MAAGRTTGAYWPEGNSMYRPEPFEETRLEVLRELMRAHPFATVVSRSGAQLSADHIPLVFDCGRGPHGTLCGHVSRANPLWRQLTDETEVLVIFQGPESYITPSWYPSKRADGRAVPTWNYALVHAYGKPSAIEDRAWLLKHVTELTRQREAPAGSRSSDSSRRSPRSPSSPSSIRTLRIPSGAPRPGRSRHTRSGTPAAGRPVRPKRREPLE